MRVVLTNSRLNIFSSAFLPLFLSSSIYLISPSPILFFLLNGKNPWLYRSKRFGILLCLVIFDLSPFFVCCQRCLKDWFIHSCVVILSPPIYWILFRPVSERSTALRLLSLRSLMMYAVCVRSTHGHLIRTL